MPLDTGMRLGPYEIESPIGAGGMGEVYRAKDTRLDRVVAIKVLPGHLSDNPQLKERFDREAKVISSLSHPNICSLFDVGHENGVDYLVMEYLEGETLLDRLKREKLTPEKVTQMGLQIAEALDRAHRSGIVHRDLKPGNIMITREGVKLLDFGLAKLGDLESKPGSGSLPGLTSMPTSADKTPATPLTQEGTILGTFQYMSPEQLEGKEADARSDIFALGAVLYEMATGQKAFSGDSQASLIASIMSSEPRSISEVVPVSPPAFDRVVKTCLAKDPEERWQTAHDVKLQLKWIGEGGSQAGVPAPVAARRRHRERTAWVIAAVAVAGVIGLGALQFLNRGAAEKQVIRYQIPVPRSLIGFSSPKISPDGTMIAFLAADTTGTSSLWVQRLNALEPQPLPGTGDAQRPFWSPDSRYLAYFTNPGKLKKVAVAGGPPQTLGEQAGAADGTWGRDGMILFDASVTDSIMGIPAKGGTAVPMSFIDRAAGETGNVWPYFLPDGRHFLYMAVGTDREDITVKVGEIGSTESRSLGKVDSRMEYSDLGYMLFVRDGTLLAQPFDVDKAEFTGDPVPVAENVASGGLNFQGSFSVSENGILTYWVGGVSQVRRLVWMDREGRELGTVGQPAVYSNAALSPDEKRLLVAIEDPRTDTDDLWMMDLERGTTSRFTFDPADDGAPVWSRDGETIVFSSQRNGNQDLFKKDANGAGEAVPFLATDSPEYTTDWSRDGQWIIGGRYLAGGNRLDVMAYPASGKEDPIAIAHTSFHEQDGHISPDGRWVAYGSMESGQWEVYVQAFPEPRGKWQISTQGGSNPRWREDGKELYYLSPDDRVMAVDVAGENTFQAGVPRALFKAPVAGGPFNLNRYQVTRDGQRFLVVSGGESTTINPMTVVVNWAEELKGE